jgi:tRNA(fMet)-specific endonuclease VapC
VSYLLDTSICVYAIKRLPAVIDRLQKLSPEDVAISVVTLAELWFGARTSSRPERTRANVDKFLVPFTVIPFDAEAAERYAEARWQLERTGQPIGERDLLISATALSRGFTIVTHNVDEFTRVPGLVVQDWV